MSNPEPGLPDETGSDAEETIIGVLGALAVIELGGLDKATSIPDLISAVHGLIAEIPSVAVGTGAVQLQALYGALLDAVQAGEVVVGHVEDTVAWVLKVAGGEALNGTTQGNDSLKSAFLNHAVDQGLPVSNPPPLVGAPLTGGRPASSIPTTSAPAPTAPAAVADITVPITVPDAGSVGGRIVTQAESTIQRVSVAVPGLTASEARGISLALGKMYENNLAVLVSVLNTIEGSLTDIRTAVNQVSDGVANNAQSLAGFQEFVTHRLDLDEERIVNLVTASTTEQGYLTSLQNQVDQLGGEVQGISGGTTPVDLSGVEGQIQGIDAQLPDFATNDQVGAISSTVAGQGTALGVIEGVVAATGLAAATMTYEDLEACCEANDAVTRPITQGGATAGLLGSLGGLLGLASLLTIGAGVVSTVLAVLDLDDSIIATVWSAEEITGIVDRVVPVVTAELAWSDTVAAGSH